MKTIPELTNEEMCVRIATFIGRDMSVCPTHLQRGCCGRDRVPLLTLEFMNFAEQSLTDGQAMEYERWLRASCAAAGYRHVISANAIMRGISFLRTIGA